jgi:hypothetical protein
MSQEKDSKSPKSHALSQDQIKETLQDVLDTCEKILPGKTDREKKAWCVRRVREALEMFDNYIPLIGMFLDNPVVDDLEAQAVNLLVDWAWDKFLRKDE